MAIIQAQAKLYQGFRSYVVDKNISANLSASFSIGHKRRDVDGNIVLDDNGFAVIDANLLPFKVVRTIADLLCPRPKPTLVDERYKTYGGGNNIINANGSVNNTNNSKIISTLTCKFPTYFRLDLEALGLPEGTDCVVKLEEGFVIEDRGIRRTSGTYPYPQAVPNPNPRNDEFVTFRTPKLFAKKALTAVSSLAYNIERIRPYVANLTGAMSFAVRLKYANANGITLTGGSFFILPSPVKTAVSGALMSVVSTISAPFVRAKEAFSDISISSLLTNESATGRIRRFEGDAPVSSFLTNVYTRFRNPGNIILETSVSQMEVTAVKEVKPITIQPVLTLLSCSPNKVVSATSFMTFTASCVKDDDIIFVWRGDNFAGYIFQTIYGLGTYYAALIDWGDGSPIQDASTFPTATYWRHTFPSHGDWTVRIKRKSNNTDILGIGGTGQIGGGQYPNWVGYNGSSIDLQRGHLLKFISFGDVGLVSINGLFSDCHYLEEVPDSLPDTIRRAGALFLVRRDNLRRWKSINHEKFGKHIEKWNVSRLVNMAQFLDMVPANEYIDYEDCDLRKWKYVSIGDSENQATYEPRSIDRFCPNTYEYYNAGALPGGRINQDLSNWIVPHYLPEFASTTHVTGGPLGVDPVWGTQGGIVPSVSTIIPNKTTVYEGDKVDFNVTTSNLDEGVLYWKIRWINRTTGNAAVSDAGLRYTDEFGRDEYRSEFFVYVVENQMNFYIDVSIDNTFATQPEAEETFVIEIYSRFAVAYSTSQPILLATSPVISIPPNIT